MKAWQDSGTDPGPPKGPSLARVPEQRLAGRWRAASSGHDADANVHLKGKGHSLRDGDGNVSARRQESEKMLNLYHTFTKLARTMTKWRNSPPELSSAPGDSPLDLEPILDRGNKGVKGC